jgi:hypothetical protein
LAVPLILLRFRQGGRADGAGNSEELRIDEAAPAEEHGYRQKKFA